MEATLTFTRTSVRPNAGILTSRTSAPGAASGLTTASIVPAIIATYDLMPKTPVNTKHTIVALRTGPDLGPVLFSGRPGAVTIGCHAGWLQSSGLVAGDVVDVRRPACATSKRAVERNSGPAGVHATAGR